MLARNIVPGLSEGAPLPRGARVTVVVNRAARSAERPSWEPLVRTVLARRLSPDFVFPDGIAEMTAVVAESARAGADAIVVAGGDGSLNCVVRALGGRDVPLALLPLGTANDLARGLGIPTNVLGAAHRVLDGSLRRLDLLEVNGEPFMTVGGLGVAADAALAANRLRRSAHLRRAVRVLGTRVYPLAAAACILLGPAPSHRVRIGYRDPDGRTHALECACAALLVANQGSFGAGLVLPTASRNDDGIFELCLVPAGSRPWLLATLAALARGRAPHLPVVRAREARIATARPLDFLGDGEELVRERTFILRVRPAALGVIC